MRFTTRGTVNALWTNINKLETTHTSDQNSLSLSILLPLLEKYNPFFVKEFFFSLAFRTFSRLQGELLKIFQLLSVLNTYVARARCHAILGKISRNRLFLEAAEEPGNLSTW